MRMMISSLLNFYFPLNSSEGASKKRVTFKTSKAQTKSPKKKARRSKKKQPVQKSLVQKKSGSKRGRRKAWIHLESTLSAVHRILIFIYSVFQLKILIKNQWHWKIGPRYFSSCFPDNLSPLQSELLLLKVH